MPEMEGRWSHVLSKELTMQQPYEKATRVGNAVWRVSRSDKLKRDEFRISWFFGMRADSDAREVRASNVVHTPVANDSTIAGKTEKNLPAFFAVVVEGDQFELFEI
jgi:hypothetical protein